MPAATNERFGYVGSDFLRENLFLRATPMNSIEAANKLSCLAENNYRRNPYYRPFEYSCIRRSKRYNRILRMFWAFHRAGKRADLTYILDNMTEGRT